VRRQPLGKQDYPYQQSGLVICHRAILACYFVQELLIASQTLINDIHLQITRSRKRLEATTALSNQMIFKTNTILI